MDYNNQNEFISNKRICDLKPMDKNIELKVILITQVSRNKLKNDLKITQFLAGDNTGTILCNFFDEVGDRLAEGDIVYIKGAYASLFKNNLVLYTPKPGLGQMLKIGEYFMTYVDFPNMSEIPWKKERDEKTGLDVFVIDKDLFNTKNI